MMARSPVVEDYLRALDAWESALNGCSQSLLSAALHVESAGKQLHSSGWREAVAAANDASTTNASTNDASTTNASTNDASTNDASTTAETPSDPLTVTVLRTAAIERKSEHVSDAALVILDPDVHALASAKMSNTFTADRQTDTQRAKKDLAIATAAGRAALSMAAAVGVALTDHWTSAEALYAAGCGGGGGSGAAAAHHGEVVMELFMGALSCSVDPGARDQLRRAPDCALGVPADTVAAATRDAAELAHLHPLQRIGGAVPVGELTLQRETIDLSLPQALFDVVYNITPLIDRKEATKSGPMVNIEAGLNYNLVERLLTIRMTPREPRQSSQPEIGAITPAGESLSVSLNRKTAGLLSGASARAYFAGIRPRAEAVATALGGLITAAIHTEAAWGYGSEAPSLRYEAPSLRYEAPRLRYEAPSLHSEAPSLRNEAPSLRYEAPSLHSEAPSLHSEAPSLRNEAPSLRNEAPSLRREFGELSKQLSSQDTACNSDALLAALVTALDTRLSAVGGALAAGESLQRVFNQIALNDSAAEAGGYICEAVGQINAGPVALRRRNALIQPIQRTPMSVLERELQLTNLLNTIDTAALIYRTIRPALESAFASAPIDWKRGPAQVKSLFLTTFRRAAERTLAASPVSCGSASLKTYALTLAI